jgi:hypothetical protein
MSNLMIHDLAQSRELDRQAMSAVRGGLGDVFFNLGIFQSVSTPMNFLNGSVIAAPVSMDVKNNPLQLATIHLS